MLSGIKNQCIAVIIVAMAINTLRTQAACRKSFTYNQKFTYGYDIACYNTSHYELSSTMARNELFLTVTNSNLVISTETFKHMGKIRTLNFTNVQITFNSSNNYGPFANLALLETLILNNCSISTFEKLLIGLNTTLRTLVLKQVNLNSSQLNAWFQSPSVGRLHSLSLQNNNINSIRTLNFCSIAHLREFDLSYNQISHLTSEANGFKCLERLTKLNLSSNRLTSFGGISSTSLNYLDLSHNFVENLDGINAPNLITLDLSHNHIVHINDTYYKRLTNLEVLNLSKNRLVHENYCSNSSKLKKLDLSFNKLVEIPTINCRSLKELNLCGNAITNGDFKAFPQNSIEVLNLSQNKMTYLNSSRIAQFSNLTHLDLSRNLLRNISMPFVPNVTLRLFNLSYNLIDNVSANVFKHVKNLQHLDLSFNMLKVLDEQIFKNLDKLQTLNLSHNLLAELNYKLVEPLENLIILDVGSNRITELDYGSIVSELPNLGAFKAKDNLLSCEFLTKMIHYFKDNSIAFSLNEHLNYDKENVEGIYCKETQHKLMELQTVDEHFSNNTKVLNDIYNQLHKDNDHRFNNVKIFACVTILIIVVVLITLAVQKCINWYRRRNYITDEMELLANQSYKRFI